MAILEVVLRQIQAGQEMINRFNYVTSAPSTQGGLSVALIDAMGGNPNDMAIPGQFPTGSLLRLLQQSQSGAVDFVDISARVLYSTTDFWETPFPPSTNGSIANDASNQPMPPFVTFGFTSNRIRTNIRRGQKRFSGLTEPNAGSNGTLLPAFVTNQLTALAGGLSNELEYDGVSPALYFAPAVCGKEAYTTPSGRTAYRYWTTESKQLEMTAIGVIWQPKETTRSQVSRQLGRGR